MHFSLSLPPPSLLIQLMTGTSPIGRPMGKKKNKRKKEGRNEKKEQDGLANWLPGSSWVAFSFFFFSPSPCLLLGVVVRVRLLPPFLGLCLQPQMTILGLVLLMVGCCPGGFARSNELRSFLLYTYNFLSLLPHFPTLWLWQPLALPYICGLLTPLFPPFFPFLSNTFLCQNRCWLWLAMNSYAQGYVVWSCLAFFRIGFQLDIIRLIRYMT